MGSGSVRRSPSPSHRFAAGPFLSRRAGEDLVDAGGWLFGFWRFWLFRCAGSAGCAISECVETQQKDRPMTATTSRQDPSRVAYQKPQPFGMMPDIFFG